MDEQKNLTEKINLPPIPKNLWDRYKIRLESYSKQREEIHSFIKANLIDGEDFGENYEDSKKKTLLKPGAEKIAGFI